MGLIERANEIRTETQNEANTAQRVGSLFVDIVTPASGRLSYFNNISISIEQGVPKKIDLNWNVGREVNVNCDVEQNDIGVTIAGEYTCYGMITFTGSSHTKYDLQLRKNNELICTCNPQTEVINNRELNLFSLDVTDFDVNDNLSIWIVGSKTESINLQRAKLVIKK